ncbi:hypothetical protein KIPB_009005 [Kipferlia bialata]|uniref:Uncharacterized protein n=1 Tax=Kipferlia bialata TaxID=797122 RepID=A0A9K3GL68_9EUKA|nr:hypothetical protein KIPB_009005 [Kipferlia bialata]|eukprot:g9005.t1
MERVFQLTFRFDGLSLASHRRTPSRSPGGGHRLKVSLNTGESAYTEHFARGNTPDPLCFTCRDEPEYFYLTVYRGHHLCASGSHRLPLTPLLTRDGWVSQTQDEDLTVTLTHANTPGPGFNAAKEPCECTIHYTSVPDFMDVGVGVDMKGAAEETLKGVEGGEGEREQDAAGIARPQEEYD